jgi:ABC-2 type transport system ATP-binding protein
MRRRVVLAMALASPAEILYLDEPTAGLDVLIQRETWELLAALKREKTILLTTHLMQEAEALADRLAIIDRGRIVARGTSAELRELAPGRQKVVVSEDSLPRERIESFCSLRRYAGNWALYTRGDEDTRRLLDIAVEHHVEASVVNTTLEDTFIQLVGRHGDLGGEARP